MSLAATFKGNTIEKIGRMAIMRQQIRWEDTDMWNILKNVVVSLIIAFVVGIVIILSFSTGLPLEVINIGSLILGVLGLALAILGVLSNTKRQSKIKVGTINRAEFYGVLVTLISIIFYLNNRIDQIMLLLVQHN